MDASQLTALLQLGPDVIGSPSYVYNLYLHWGGAQLLNGKVDASQLLATALLQLVHRPDVIGSPSYVYIYTSTGELLSCCMED